MKLLLALLFINSCSNISILNSTHYYSEGFLEQLESIQIIYRDGDKNLAISKLNGLADDKLNQDEKAKKYNLKGVMYYRSGDIVTAIENFLVAKKNIYKDVYLANQIRLNLGSAFFKQSQFKKAYDEIKIIDSEYFQEREQNTYHKILFSLSNQAGDFKRTVKSLLYLSRNISSISKVDSFDHKEILIDNFKKMSDSERVYLLDENSRKNPYVIAYLGRLETLGRLYKGDREGAADVVSWLNKKFNHIDEIKKFVRDFELRVDNFSKISPSSIGLITALTGKTQKWGKQALSGLNTALGRLSKAENLLKVFVKDNQNNPYLARQMVKELVEKHHVSVIIGGLFPELAREEYLEARKYGVLYLSLSPVYLPRSEKNHLLIEVAGSVESQVAALLKSPLMETLGRKMAILHPDRQEGYSYLNEFWSLHNSDKVQLVNSNKYERGIKDYREPVKKLLGLKYPRERKEEFLVWKDIKNIEKGNVRIINVLPPVVDFDWVFIPSLPSEAIQIIPTFSYFDAGNIRFVGGPSWMNNSLKNNKRNLGEMYVVGNETDEGSVKFARMYRDVNNRLPHLVDTLSYEAMMIAINLITKNRFEKREEFEAIIRSTKSLRGITSYWDMDEGLWYKRMDILKVFKKGFQKINFVPGSNI